MKNQKHKAWKSPLVKEAVAVLKGHYQKNTQYLKNHPASTIENLQSGGHEIISVLAETGTLDAATLAYTVLDEGFNSTGERLDASKLSPKLSRLGQAVASRKDNAKVYLLLPTKMPKLDQMTPSGIKVTIASAISSFEGLIAHAADHGPKRLKIEYPNIVSAITKYRTHIAGWQKKTGSLPAPLFAKFNETCRQLLATQKKEWHKKYLVKNLSLRFNNTAEISFREQQLVRLVDEYTSDYIHQGSSARYYQKALPEIMADPNTYPDMPLALEARLQSMDCFMAGFLGAKAAAKFACAEILLPLTAREILTFKKGMSESKDTLKKNYMARTFNKSSLNIVCKHLEKLNDQQLKDPAFLASKLKPVMDKIWGF